MEVRTQNREWRQKRTGRRGERRDEGMWNTRRQFIFVSLLLCAVFMCYVLFYRIIYSLLYLLYFLIYSLSMLCSLSSYYLFSLLCSLFFCYLFSFYALFFVILLFYSLSSLFSFLMVFVLYVLFSSLFSTFLSLSLCFCLPCSLLFSSCSLPLCLLSSP